MSGQIHALAVWLHGCQRASESARARLILQKLYNLGISDRLLLQTLALSINLGIPYW